MYVSSMMNDLRLFLRWPQSDGSMDLEPDLNRLSCRLTSSVSFSGRWKSVLFIDRYYHHLFKYRSNSIMQWCSVSALALLICLQIASEAYVNAQDFSTNYAEIGKLRTRVNDVSKFIKNRADWVILTYGVKSATNGTFVRALTSVPLPNGDPALGVPLANAAVIAALNAKRTFRGPVEFYGKNYSSVFEPIMSKKSGDVTGYYFAGVLI